jgi:cell division protein FtsL
MKKLIIVLVMVLGLMLPLYVKAETKSLNLKEALEEEKSELDKGWEGYSENDDQAIIYLFRGNGCGYCRAFLTFLNGITSEYGKYFKLVSYEVWNDQTNAALLDSVSNYLDNPAYGVPYIIIGDKVFAGYASDYDEDIKTTIVDLYNTKKSKRYDVMAEMKKNPNKDAKSGTTSDNKVIIWALVFTAVALIVNLVYMGNRFGELKVEFDKLHEEVQELKTKPETKTKAASKKKTK